MPREAQKYLRRTEGTTDDQLPTWEYDAVRSLKRSEVRAAVGFGTVLYW